mmetsp:Transcript_35179/g.75067  ORF Transcript_35179/g.75067 Transcript_35179/m.75067 type:complete len:182 (+) Transcript_35179:254-799(+)
MEAEDPAAATTVMITKPSKDAKVGIGLTGEGTIKITTIAPDGLLSGATLEVGMELDTINENKFDTATEATAMLKEAEGQITIVARHVKDTPTTPLLPPGDSSDPPGAPSGGVWGTNTYSGDKTKAAACVGCLCCCLPGLLILLCPFDERDAYKKDNGVYLADGKKLEAGAKFTPKRQVMQR